MNIQQKNSTFNINSIFNEKIQVVNSASNKNSMVSQRIQHLMEILNIQENKDSILFHAYSTTIPRLLNGHSMTIHIFVPGDTQENENGASLRLHLFVFGVNQGN